MADDTSEIPANTDLPLQRLVTYRLLRLNAKLSAQAARILKKTSGLSVTQWRVLAIVDARGEATLADIARTTAMDKGQLSRTIQGMLSQGLLEAQRSESDHRVQLLTITETGRGRYDRARPAMHARQTVLTNSLDSAEHDALLRAFDKLEAAARDLEGRK